jgi:GNAT superfamily N-acetyltransferase
VSFLLEKCRFLPLSGSILNVCEPFSCGHEDLDDFFKSDCLKYSQELLGKSYCFVLQDSPEIIVCAFTVANDSIKVNYLPNNRKKKITKNIPREKQMRSYPAVLIGRLGVNKDFIIKGIGSELMDFIKAWFIDPFNKTGCRFIVVDAYNEDIPIRYYLKNGFEPIFSTEDQEAESLDMPLIEGEKLATRLMAFDLITLSASSFRKMNIAKPE